LRPPPSPAPIARRVLEAFAAARAGGEARLELDGSLIEKPMADKAERLLRRAKELGAIEEGG
jgi:citrate lyase beta subunit